MSELLVVGASHKTAPLGLRERLALSSDQMRSLFEDMGLRPEIEEQIALSTCNRTELYVVGCPIDAEPTVIELLAKRAGVSSTELLEGIYTHRNCDAARHLFRVTSGLESMILGEAEVQGQVKRAYDFALAHGTTGPLTNRLFRAAIGAGKRVRTQTGVGTGKANVASVAMDLARRVVGDLAGRKVLVIGTGEVGELTANALSRDGVSTTFIASRRRERAIALAQRFGGDTASFQDLPQQLEKVDIVIAATASPHTIVGAKELAEVMMTRGGRPLLVIDLAVPRDIGHECRGLPNVTVFDIDDLHSQIQVTHNIRHAEQIHAERVIDEEIQSFASWLGVLEVAPTIAALRSQAEAIVTGILAENEGKWESLGERDRERVEAIARATTNRLLHSPTKRIKELQSDRRHARLHLLRELFELDHSPPDEKRDWAQCPTAQITAIGAPRPVSKSSI